MRACRRGRHRRQARRRRPKVVLAAFGALLSYAVFHGLVQGDYDWRYRVPIRPRRRGRAALPSFERVWSEEALRWRLANPERSYAVRWQSDGISISTATGLPGIAALLHHGPGDARLAADGPPAGPMRLWLGQDPDIAWHLSAFVPIPERLRPSPLNLFFRDLTGGGFAPDPGRLIFQALDFDAY